MVPEYEAMSPASQVKGNAIRAIINGIMHKEVALDILAKHGITDIDSEKWYTEQSWLDAFAEIGEALGDAALYAIGRSVPPVITLPDDIQDGIDALNRLNDVYQAHHRGESGRYEVTITGDSSARIASKNPRPCPYDMGFVTAYVEKYNGGVPVKIEHEDDMCCRKRHYFECVYLIKW